MGLSIGVVAMIMTSGRPPRRSTAFSPFFDFAPWSGYKILVNIYIYIYIGIVIKVVENLCYYTFEPSRPNYSELGS
jgi:uncharacterized membrane protein SirB2